jgi:glycyl-tRNA synthetase beta chain
MAELLVEVLSEDIPARMQDRAAQAFADLMADGLKKAGLSFDAIKPHSTPRRIAVLVEGLPTMRADTAEEKRGPRVGAPQPAIDGFLKSMGFASLDEAEQRDTGKGVFWFGVTRTKGGPTADALPAIIVAAIQNVPWPKSMRWNVSTFRWVRPLQSILAVFDGKPLAGSLDLGNGLSIAFGDQTRGHRFLSGADFVALDFASYKEQLKGAKVLLDRDMRAFVIRSELQRVANENGLAPPDDEELVQEVCGLVEWPVVMLGSIDQRFMELPPEVRRATMRANQKYFALSDMKGLPAPRFAFVSNMMTEDGGKAVIAGNERVLRARLSDAKYFWDKDRQTKLGAYAEKLSDITFHEKLGTMAQKAARLEALARVLAPFCKADEKEAALAGKLAKADLVSGMVGEFPELQGIMGRYYALNEGLSESVAEAIGAHYKPHGPNDIVPSAPVSIALALADKIDTLVGFFSIGEKPTGSKDPFALRRAALGLIRIIVENGVRLSLHSILAASSRDYLASKLFAAFLEADLEVIAAIETIQKYRPGSQLEDASAGAFRLSDFGGVITDFGPEYLSNSDLLAFIFDRLKVALKDQGVRHDLIDAVLALENEDDLVRLLARVGALAAFLGTGDGANLLALTRRAGNILKIEEKKDGRSYDGTVDPALLEAAAEQALAHALTEAEAAFGPKLAAEDFAGALAVLATLREPIDRFFNEVTVNTDIPAVRANRLQLLARLRYTVHRLADFSKIEG